MPGTLRKIGPADIEGLDPHPGDHIPRSYRLERYERLEAQHQESRAAVGDVAWGLELILGEKGSGKSTYATAMAAKAYAAGRPVVSNLSLLFGWHIQDVRDVFTFGRSLPPGTLLVLDEIHSVLSRYDQGSLRSRSMIAALAGLRKQRIQLIGISSQEAMLSHDFRGEVDTAHLVKPGHYRPAESRGKKAAYPPWCHITIRTLSPKPWQAAGGNSIFNQHGVKTGHRRVRLRRLRPSPDLVYRAASLQASFQALPYSGGEATAVMAKDVREAMLSAEAGGVLQLADEGMEGDFSEEEALTWKEQVDRDTPEITRLWRVIHTLRLQSEKSQALAPFCTKAVLVGEEFEPQAVAAMLVRWGVMGKETDTHFACTDVAAYFRQAA